MLHHTSHVTNVTINRESTFDTTFDIQTIKAIQTKRLSRLTRLPTQFKTIQTIHACHITHYMSRMTQLTGNQPLTQHVMPFWK